MHFIRSVFYWASQGCPEGGPKGIIAVDLGDTADLATDVKEVGLALCSQGFFYDTTWQVGATQEDVDVILKLIPHEKYGEIGQTLSFDHIIPDWQYELIKQRPGLVVSEHSLADMHDLDYLCVAP
ncbi:hypothetical protein OAK65_01170 [Synechococcus sp. AH-551-N17]|nr:hypothetical protein [Synechococcus sp. AH-551-N17]